MNTQPLDQSRPSATIRVPNPWDDPRHRWTIGEAVTRWLTARHGWSPITITRYTRALDRFAGDMGGPTVYLDTVRALDYQAWVSDLKPLRVNSVRKGKDYSASALNTTVAPVRAFYTWAVALKIVADNPTLDTPPARVGKRPPSRLSRADCQRLLRAAAARERVQLTLFLVYGLRLAELQRIHIEDWDRERDLLTILGKGNKVRILPVYGEARVELTGWCDFVLRSGRGPMWPSPRRPDVNIGAGLIGRNISGLGEALGLHVHPHLLRHTALSDMVEEGLDLETVRTIAGHETLATLSIYTSAAPEHVRRSMSGRRQAYGSLPGFAPHAEDVGQGSQDGGAVDDHPNTE